MSKTTYLRRKAEGVCVWCAGELDGNGIICKSCRDKQSQRRKEDRKFFKSMGICPRCKKNKLMGSEKNCPECLAYMQIVNQKSKDKEKEKIYYKQRYENLKTKGICTKCSKRKSVTGKTYCSICLANKRERERKRRGFDIDRNERPNYNQCYFCGVDIESGKRTCESCRQRCIDNLPIEPHKNMDWARDNRAIFLRKVGG